MLKKLFNTELGKGAVVLFITMNIFNFLNFLFHFAMARTLGPSDYGVLAVLMSIIYVYSVPTEAIQTIISRYTSKFNLAREYGKMKFLLFRTLKKGVGFSLAIFAISILASFPISIFLKINFWLILLTNLFVFYAITGPIIKGVIQGRKQFGLLGINLIMESAIRLALAIFLVALGFGVFGAMIGVLIGVAMSLIISLYFSRDIIQVKEEPTYIGGMRSESISYFLTMFVIFSMFSIDIILAKRFFLPDVAGKYAVLSMLGKMIFLGTVAISKAMFPLASEKHDGKEDSS